MWPDRFHVLLITWKNDPTFLPDLDMRGSALGVDDLYYDWPGGNNVIVMRMQHQEGDTVDWACNTGWYTYTPSLKQCTSRHVPFGVLRRDWLANATYEGTEVVRGFTCHKWAKLDFITYWADVETEHPVRWMFFTGMVQEVVQYTEGEPPPTKYLRVPEYCQKDTHNVDTQADAQPPHASRWALFLSTEHLAVSVNLSNVSTYQ